MERERRFGPGAPAAVDAGAGGGENRLLQVARQRRMVERKCESQGGAPLPAAEQQRFGAALGADLSEVRVHTGGQSAQAAKQLGAKAYTVGSDVHFADGRFAPGTREGDRLLAHELTHTLQGGTEVRCMAEDGPDDHDPAEREADQAADDAAPQLDKSPEEQAAESEANEQLLLIPPAPDPWDQGLCDKLKGYHLKCGDWMARYPGNQAIRTFADKVHSAEKAMCAAAKEALEGLMSTVDGLSPDQPDAMDKLAAVEEQLQAWAQHPIAGKIQPFAPMERYLIVQLRVGRKKRELQPAQGPRPPDLPVPDFSGGDEEEPAEDFADPQTDQSPERVNALARMRVMVRIAKIIDELRQLKEDALGPLLDLIPIVAQLHSGASALKGLAAGIKERLLIKHLETLPDAELEAELETWKVSLPKFGELLEEHEEDIAQLQGLLGVGELIGMGEARDSDPAAEQTNHTKRDLAITGAKAGLSFAVKSLPGFGVLLGKGAALASANLRLKLAQDELKRLEEAGGAAATSAAAV